MQDRAGWDSHWREIEEEEVRRLRSMPVNESLRMFGVLWEAFRERFREEEEEHLREREAVLTERQRRLVRLAEWLATNAG